MIITSHSRNERFELQLEGRFDANWADRVGKAIDAAIRAGHHQLDLDFAKVDYLSSAGIRVLLKYYKQLKTARGTLRVLRPTEAVFGVLQLSGIAGTLVSAAEHQANASPGSAREAAEGAPRTWDAGGTLFEAHALAASAPLEVSVIGQPDAFATGRLEAARSTRVRCTPDLLTVGLGAFGRGPEDTKGRFGESLAVAGVAVTLPTDGSSVPDYQVSEGQLVPELHLLYGVAARGGFSKLIRFEAGRGPRGVIGFGELVERALEELNQDGGALVILAESASVVGAMLQRFPALAEGRPVLAFPEVRDWLSFTTERTDERNLVLIAGIAERPPRPALAAGLRAIGPGTTAHGHFHAAVFPYRPLPKGRLDLGETLAHVLGTESARVVMHLLADEREFEGIGQTDLMRGACWVGPLQDAPPRKPPGGNLAPEPRGTPSPAPIS